MKVTISRPLPAAFLGFLLLLLAGCGDQSGPPLGDALLGRVPAETPYLFANREPLPQGAAEKWLELYRQAMGWYRELISRQAPPRNADEAKLRALLDGLLAELQSNSSPEGFERLGLRLDGRSAVYGEGLLPVGRHEIADPAKVTAFIERIEARLGERAQRARFGALEYLRIPLGERAFVLGLPDRQLVWAFLPAIEETARLPRLFGDERPPRSLAETDELGQLLAREGLPGYGDGYVDLQRLFALLQPLAAQSAALDGACTRLVETALEAVPRLVMGTTEATADRVSTRLLVETDARVGNYLAGLAYPVPGLGRASEALFAMGVGVDVPRLRGALRTLLHFIGEAGADCPWVDPVSIAAALPKLELALGPMTAMFKGLYVELLDLEMTRSGQTPTTVRLRALAEVDDPQGVFAMAGLLSPELARLEVPVDGTPTRVPQQLLPPGAPGLTVAIRNRSLVLASGDDGERLAAELLAAAPLQPPPLLAISYDLSQMSGLMEQMGSQYLDTLATQSGRSAEDLAAELESAARMYEAYGSISMQVSAGAGGLRLDQTVVFR
jgi:hypothetical protein